MKRITAAVALVTLLLMATVLQGDNAFYRVLAAKPNATFKDAVRGFLELCTGKDPGEAAFEKQAVALTDMKVIKGKWAKNPEAKLTRGRAAYMICRACGIRGGVTMTITGTTERYAYRECVFLGVWREGGTQRDYMTGSELMGVLKWAADYMDEHPDKKVKASESAASLTSEAKGTSERAPAKP